MSAWTMDDLAKLEKAIASGALVVKYASGEVTYRKLEDMYSIRRKMRRSLGLSSGTRRITAKTSKGLD